MLENPMIGIENRPTIKKLPDPLSNDERGRILEDMATQYDERVFAYFLWMFYSGMRPEEAIALRWSDINWENQTIRVRRVRTFRGQDEREGSKTDEEREVALMPQAIQALKIMSQYTFHLKTKRQKDADETADIFQNPVTDKHWHDERSQRDHYWKPTLNRLGIRWRRPYNTRHTFATAALMGGVTPAYIARQLGHDVKVLLEKYARWIKENDDGNARKQLTSVMKKSSNSSQILPKTGQEEEEGLNLKEFIGRRDWTRTNDPHHVKVVL